MQPVWVPRLGDYVRLAARVLGLAPDTVGRFPNLPLADSALHAPFAEFGWSFGVFGHLHPGGCVGGAVGPKPPAT